MSFGPTGKSLEYFMAAVTMGSVRGAAEACNVEASVVSRQIAALETELGTELLERRGRGIVPTEAAGLLVAYCRGRLSDMETLQTQLAELAGLARGHLDMLVGDGFVETLMAEAVHPFLRRYPNIRISLTAAAAKAAVRAVAEDRCHLGIALSPPADPETEAAWTWPYPICAIIPPGHALAKSETPLSLAEIARHPVALAAAGTGLRTILDQAMSQEHIGLAPVFTSNALPALRHFAAAGLGITFLSAQAAQAVGLRGDVAVRRVDNRTLNESNIQLLVRRGGKRSPALARFLKIACVPALFSVKPANKIR